jgi:hypothetical protein
MIPHVSAVFQDLHIDQTRWAEGHVQKRAVVDRYPNSCISKLAITHYIYTHIYMHCVYIISYIYIISYHIYIYYLYIYIQILTMTNFPDAVMISWDSRSTTSPGKGTASKHFPPTATSGTCEDWPRWALAAINYCTIYIYCTYTCIYIYIYVYVCGNIYIYIHTWCVV